MIPKKIHYCWFGGKEMPKQYQRYIEGWKKIMPDWEILRWDESNFDVKDIPFIAHEYEKGQFAFVSDYARFKILYEHGGIYLDTDVELIKSLEDIAAKGSFMGFEKNSNAPDGSILNVNVGLGFALESGNEIAKEVLEIYENKPEKQTVVAVVTNLLKKYGLDRSDIPVSVKGITIYPWDWLCPMEFLNPKIEITDNTHSIHHYSGSWVPWKNRIRMQLRFYQRKLEKLFCGQDS